MPSAGLFRTLLLLSLFTAAPAFAAEPSSSSTPSYPTEIDGKNLSQWLADLKHADASVRDEAIRAVVRFGPPTADVMKALLERTEDFDASPRVSIIMILGQIAIPKESVSHVVEALAKHVNRDIEPQGVVRYQAAIALNRFGEDGKPAIASLARATEDPSSWQIRRAAVVALTHASYGKNGTSDLRGYRALHLALKDTAYQVRLEAVLGLGNLGRCPDATMQAGIEHSLLGLANGSDKVLAIWAIVSLMMHEHPDDKLITMVARNVKNPDLRIRTNAVRAIGVMGSRAKQYIPELIEALDAREAGFVYQAISSLASMGDSAMPAVPALTKLSERKVDGLEGVEKSEQAGLVKAAKDALEIIKKPAKP